MEIPFSSVGRQYFVQNAYHVADLDEAVSRWHRQFGLGPFVVRRNLALPEVLYRGAPATLRISAAHVQAGPIQIELVQQHCDSRSAFRDMFPADGEGLHHVAVFPEDHDALVAHYARLGFPVATELTTAEGRGASYVDTRPALGHMIEVYKVNQSLLDFYVFVAAAAKDWNGRQLVIEG